MVETPALRLPQATLHVGASEATGQLARLPLVGDLDGFPIVDDLVAPGPLGIDPLQTMQQAQFIQSRTPARLEEFSDDPVGLRE